MGVRRLFASRIGRWFLALACVAAGAGAVLGQQKSAAGLRVPDEQVIETSISEMLAGWQIGDEDLLHRHYADDVMVVSGAYEPPLIGWANYVPAYRGQRQRLQNVRLDRRNTYIKVKGDFAWASYQWEFSAVADGRQMAAQGQATLLFEKRGDRWQIVHNHTSVISVSSAPPQPAPPPQEKPGR